METTMTWEEKGITVELTYSHGGWVGKATRRSDGRGTLPGWTTYGRTAEAVMGAIVSVETARKEA